MDETTNSRDVADEADDRESIAGIEENSQDKKENNRRERREKKHASGAKSKWKKNSRFKKSTLVMMIVSVASCALTILLGIATAFMADFGVMDGYSRESMLNYQMELLMDRYSVWALSDAISIWISSKRPICIWESSAAKRMILTPKILRIRATM